MTAPSNANTSGLEVVAWRWRFRTDGVWNYQEAQQHIPDVTCEPLVTAASAQAAIDAEKARADRLAKDAKGLLAEIASFGRAFMAAQESLASTSTPDAYDDAILAASVRYQSMVKTASALYRAALQQETQP